MENQSPTFLSQETLILYLSRQQLMSCNMEPKLRPSLEDYAMQLLTGVNLCNIVDERFQQTLKGTNNSPT